MSDLKRDLRNRQRRARTNGSFNKSTERDIGSKAFNQDRDLAAIWLAKYGFNRHGKPLKRGRSNVTA